MRIVGGIKLLTAFKDAEGNIIEIKAEYYPDSKSGSDTSGIKVRSAIQWVDAKRAKRAEVRLYDRLYKVEAPEGLEDLNPDSLKVVKEALIEPAVIEEKPDVRFQFEREGYFYADPVDYRDDAPVFNKIVGLKDSWGKKKKEAPKAAEKKPKQQPKKQQIDGEEAPMSEAQKARFDTYTQTFGLNHAVANTLARDAKLSSFFEEALKGTEVDAVTLANLVANEVARELKHMESDTLHITPAQIAQLVKMVDDETISGKIAKEVFEEMVKRGEDPQEIVQSKGLVQISDPAQIVPVIDEVIANNPQNAEKYRAGNKKLLGFFVGQVLKATRGKANPKVVNELVAERLEK